jgi:hypothetical protein
MNGNATGRRGASLGFTLIEMLTVIAIIMLVMAMALPSFMEMMRGRRWTAAVGEIQMMVMRARALATNVRKDFSVEFEISGDRTWMWIESEEQVLERIPDLDELQHRLGGGGAIYWIRSLWYNAGGTDKWGKYEATCPKCGHEWVEYSPPSACPKCGSSEWPYRPQYQTYYYDFRLSNDPQDFDYGDNARQSEYVRLEPSLTIDPSSTASPNFINWDAPESVECYGYDEYKDIRIGPNGALVQTLDPVICIRERGKRDDVQVKRVQIVRCTGRVIPVD